MVQHKYEIIIVGGGIAGLTSAAYLSREGKKVLLIEKNAKCGGLVSSFAHNGFHFDAGIRALENAGIIFPMLNDLNIELDVVKSPVSIGIENEILNIVDLDSLNDYREILLKFYPNSKEEINKVINIVKKIMKHMDVLYRIENPVFIDLKRNKSFIFKKLLLWLPKFIFTVRKINRLNIPVEDYLDSIIKDSSLKDIISQHFFKNTPTFFALSYFSLYLDYFYPLGGTGKLPEGLVNKINEFNGEIKTQTTIVKVIADKSLVEDDKGVFYKYDKLIWAADLKNFYKITNTDGLVPKILKKFETVKTKISNSRGGDSVFTLFLEVDEPLESFKEIANGHFFYTPSKLGLGNTHWDELDNLLNNWESTNKQQILHWLDKFVKLNTFEISIPGLKDRRLVPTGKTGLIISFLAEYDLFKNVYSSGWYDEFINELEMRIINVISDSVYPMLKEKIINRFSFTPLSIENRVGSSEGAITGWSFQKPVPVVNNIIISNRSIFTPIPSIYNIGQWAYSPSGVPMSILTGKLAADKILKKLPAGNFN